MAAAAHPPLLQMRGISKAFPGVQALSGVGLTLHAGEVLALLGENGAGKSTLIKILGGAHAHDEGELTIDGSPARIDSPQASQAAGIGIIYQEFNLVPGLTARENIFLGQEPARVSFIPHQKEADRARKLFQRIGVEIDPNALCRDLTVAQQQVVEIAKALAQDARIIVMDEPTAALTPREVDGLLQVVSELRTQGIGIIYISHRLDEIDAIADRVTVLRDGSHVATRDKTDLARDKMIELMVGRSLDKEFPSHDCQPGPVRLAVKNLARGNKVRDVSFELHAGEIVGLTGLVGAGRTETARLIFGADRRIRAQWNWTANPSMPPRRAMPYAPAFACLPRIANRRASCSVKPYRKISAYPTCGNSPGAASLTDKRRAMPSPSLLNKSRSRYPIMNNSHAIYPAATSKRSCSPSGFNAMPT